MHPSIHPSIYPSSPEGCVFYTDTGNFVPAAGGRIGAGPSPRAAPTA